MDFRSIAVSKKFVWDRSSLQRLKPTPKHLTVEEWDAVLQGEKPSPISPTPLPCRDPAPRNLDGRHERKLRTWRVEERGGRKKRKKEVEEEESVER